MPKAHPADNDLQQLYQHLANDLAQARDLDEAISVCLGLLERCLRPRVCQIVWMATDRPRLLAGRGDLPLQVPSAAQRARLEAGELCLSPAFDRPTTCFVPLRARAALVGWVMVDQPAWSDSSFALLQQFGRDASPVLALLEASERYEDRVAQLSSLTDIGRMLSGVLDLTTLLDTIYHTSARVVDVSNFYIALYDEAHDLLEMAYYVNEGERWPAGARWKPSDGLAGVLIAQRAPLCTDDYAAECRRYGLEPLPINDARIVKAWLGVPLFAQDRLVGLLNISSYREGYSYSDEHVALLTTIGAQAAVAIDNARLYERADRQARQLASLNQIGRILTSSLDPERVPALIMEQVCKLMNVEEGSLLLTENGSGDLVFAYTTGPIGHQLLGQRVPRGVGLAGFVVATGESVISNDVQRDNRFYPTTDQTTGYTTRALMAVPLCGVAGVQGVIEVMNRSDGRPFSNADLQLLQAFADQAVIALENARKFAQVDQALTRRAQELARTNDMLQHNLQSLIALNALGLAINASLRSPREIFSMSIRGLVEITNALGGEILLLEEGQLHASVQVGRVPRQLPLEAAIQRVIQRERPELEQIDVGEIQTALVVPLAATQRVLGVLCAYYPAGLPIESDQETVVLFATQAARAVENIELFTEISAARDQMASILASTHEGFLLIDPNAQIAIANDALTRLTGLEQHYIEQGNVQDFLTMWVAVTDYAPDQWIQLRRGLDAVISGSASAASGNLDATRVSDRSIEWTALTAKGSGAAPAGALLVLHDVTEAKEAERLRQDLTNMIVHDLRSPLASVMAGIDLLMRGISGELNNNQRNVLNIAYTSATQMLEMVNTLLDISRLEDGRMPLERRPCPLPPLMARARERLASLAHDRSITIEEELSPSLPLIYADEELIVRVVQNLLANAIKFSGRGSTVRLRAWILEELPDADGAGEGVQPPLVCFAVSDQGVGIAPKDIDKIFAKFSQVGERRGGTGLGLTFCKLVTAAHDGLIWVESTLGRGSSFFVALPPTTVEEQRSKLRGDHLMTSR
jgi:signal transduction histidine kinase/putative methionine-R-sulfoxide reductase with GAF domain